jgi:hypothetical protein
MSYIIFTNVMCLSTISTSLAMMAFEELLSFTPMKGVFSNYHLPDTKNISITFAT